MGAWQPDADNIIEALKKWRPTDCSTEIDYEKSVYHFLHAEFPKEVFQKQYSYGNTKSDIFVKLIDGAPVAIEVKSDLKDRNEYHRLLGQTWTYVSEWKSDVVIILCGNSDPALIKLTRRFVEFLTEFKRKVQIYSLTDG